MKKFEIRVVILDPTVGAEMKRQGPCLIVSPDELNANLKTVIIAPLTSVQRCLPTRIFIKATNESGLANDSYAVLDQIKPLINQGWPVLLERYPRLRSMQSRNS